MDLFVVQRYEGDDPKSKTDVSDSKSNHLERLLSKIQNRKTALLLDQINKKKILPEKKKRLKKKIKDEVCSVPEEIQGKVKPTNSDKKKKNVKPNRKSKTVTDGKFVILGDKSLGVKKAQVEAQLPHWLANPSIVSVDLQNLTVSVDDIPQLDKDIVKKLRQNGISYFFPVQHQVIPCLLEKQGKPSHFWARDICVSAPTGSGKTYAFVLPIVQALRSRLVCHVRALVVLPVQNLASQVYKVFHEYASGLTNLSVVCINGMESFEQEQSQLIFYSEADNKFHSRADIVITTPGRLVDHLLSTKGFSLHHLEYLVIDEADRVMESMQNDWLYHLDNHICPGNSQRVPPLTVKDIAARNPPPQKLLFSATLSNDPEQLQQLGLFQPRLFTSIVSGSSAEKSASSFVGKFTTPAELTESWVTCEDATKPLLLYHLILQGNWNSVIVFANTLENVHRLSGLMKHLLKNSKKVSEFSSSLRPQKRRKILKEFETGAINVLVCSDAAARGIDIPNVDCVISYDAPKFIRNYIHRVGRTGRAGRQGSAITLLLERQKNMFISMLSKAGKESMVREKEVDNASLEALQDDLKDALIGLKADVEQEQEKIHEKLKVKVKKPLKKSMLQGVKKSSSEATKKVVASRKLKKLIRDKKI